MGFRSRAVRQSNLDLTGLCRSRRCCAQRQSAALLCVCVQNDLIGGPAIKNKKECASDQMWLGKKRSNIFKGLIRRNSRRGAVTTQTFTSSAWLKIKHGRILRKDKGDCRSLSNRIPARYDLDMNIFQFAEEDIAVDTELESLRCKILSNPACLNSLKLIFSTYTHEPKMKVTFTDDRSLLISKTPGLMPRISILSLSPGVGFTFIFFPSLHIGHHDVIIPDSTRCSSAERRLAA